MARFVLSPDAAMTLAASNAAVPAHHRLLAPTLLRSQVLAQLFAEVRHGVLTRKEAELRLEYLRKLHLRFLGDRALQQLAWRLAEQLGWSDTFVAEYVALVQLQADALVTDDPEVKKAAKNVVALASTRDLLS